MADSQKKHSDEEILAAVEQHGSLSAAADALGVDRRGLSRRVRRLEAREDRGGAVLEGQTVWPMMPEGQRLRGVSTLTEVVDPNTGKAVMQWVKTERDRDAAEQQTLEVLEALKSELPKYEPRPFSDPGFAGADLASVFTITDYHMGMYSWAEETGDDWDMKIAEDLLVSWFAKALALSPQAAVGVLAQLGDFLHYDSLEAITPTSKHMLDADSRAQKMIRVSIRVLRHCINMMLEKYPKVIVVMAEGNHDIVSSAWLREAFKVIYETEPRVEIITSPDPYYAIEWGACGLFWHHGHLKKVAQLDKVFARKFREIFGRVKFCYAHTGHLHHEHKIETALMKIEQHPTLAGADAYASRHGYMSDRCADVITYHARYGEVSRLTIPPEMARA